MTMYTECVHRLINLLIAQSRYKHGEHNTTV